MFITNLNSNWENPRNLLDGIFNDLVSSYKVRLSPEFKLGSGYKPYKIDSDEDGVTLTMNVPGYNKKLIDVSVNEDSLTIEGKAHTGSTDGFNHTFIINDNLNADKIDATVIDGVLTINIPYLEEIKPKQINIEVK